ncbi:hypothetical protein CYMTET_26896, partial [Cymbomonas tetramitiformis]
MQHSFNNSICGGRVAVRETATAVRVTGGPASPEPSRVYFYGLSLSLPQNSSEQSSEYSSEYSTEASDTFYGLGGSLEVVLTTCSALVSGTQYYVYLVAEGGGLTSEAVMLELLTAADTPLVTPPPPFLPPPLPPSPPHGPSTH